MGIEKILRLFFPPGVVVAVLGVDGVGKSTLISSLLEAVGATTGSPVVVRHLRPTVLPPLGRLVCGKAVSASNVQMPHGSNPSGMLGSLFRLTYLTVDYVLGYWLWTRPKITKEPTVVVFDRYAYDLILDPRRFRIGLSSRVAEWFAALAPKPDLIVCLHGVPEVIAARKNELTVEETRRQIEALRSFARGEPRAILVSTDNSVEDARDAVVSALMTQLRAKGKRRY